jgi:AbiV family abortive infection protein
MVTARYLLEGSVYALHHCGSLLTDAETLYRSGSYPNVIVLAAFAREELGRSLVLRQLRRELLAGAPLSVKDVRSRCRDHIEKQRQAQLSVVQHGQPGDEMDARIRTVLHARPNTEEWTEAMRLLDEDVARQRATVPGERHDLRMRCLYVDPDDTGTVWLRPSDVCREEATEFFQHAVNDYLGQYDRIQNLTIFGDDELLAALRDWKDRPALPPPFLS